MPKTRPSVGVIFRTIHLESRHSYFHPVFKSSVMTWQHCTSEAAVGRTTSVREAGRPRTGSGPRTTPDGSVVRTPTARMPGSGDTET